MTHSLRARRFVGALMLSGACLSAGCGPTTAHLAIADARVALEAARGARAETYAIFEYTSAVEHLRKAREEEGYSEFAAALRFARSARDYAMKARARALGRPASAAARVDGQTPVRVVMPGSAP